MRIARLLIPLAAVGIVAAGCSSKEEPAKAAVASAETALAQVRDDAARYAPEQLQAVDARVEGLKTSLAREEYKEVLAATPAVRTEVAALHDVVVARQTQVAAATNEWESLKEEVPQLVKDIEVRVDALTGIRLPRDVSKENFEAAKSDLASIKSQWEEATAAFGAGDATAAADKGREVKSKAEEIKGKLAIPAV
jgi:predicted  nucleic acid-binding Zn-ribbon protein